jgi:cytochrome b561
MPTSPASRYNVVAMSLHWLIAVLLISNIGLAWWFNALHGAAKIPPVQLHRSIGITILLVSVFRLAWRFISPPPRLPVTLKSWERICAGTVYVLFYVVMIGMPLSGWALTSASGYIKLYPMKLYGIIPWPTINYLASLPAPEMKKAQEFYAATHGLLAKLAYALIVLHLLAALRHLFLLRDGVGARMVPFLKPKAA